MCEIKFDQRDLAILLADGKRLDADNIVSELKEQLENGKIIHVENQNAIIERFEKLTIDTPKKLKNWYEQILRGEL